MGLIFYEATSTFTFVTTRIFARPPSAVFVDGLQHCQFPYLLPSKLHGSGLLPWWDFHPLECSTLRLGTLKDKIDIVSYSDLSNLGSSGGIYSNQEIPLTERATRFLVDSLSDIHENLYETFVEASETFDLSQTGPLLDQLAKTVTEVRVIGSIEQETSGQQSFSDRSEDKLSLTISPNQFNACVGVTRASEATQILSQKQKVSGSERHSVHFGAVLRILEKISKVVSPHRIWILLDEWSSLPLELQPYLADLLRRCVFPIRDITVKIAAIDYRSQFQLSEMPSDYVGIEVGADASTDIDLDSFMVFDNDEFRSRNFFKSLFHKHLVVSEDLANTDVAGWSSDEIISSAFTQLSSFDELVRAAEGVPRDAIHIASLAAQYAVNDKISLQHIRRAAKNWYQTGKEAAIHSRETAIALLHWIVDKVIADRKARAFMLRSNVKHPLIEDLFDSRVLHVLKKGISTHDEPGARYDAYKLDYGCYVDLMATSRAPMGLFQVDTPEDNAGFVDVPADDYRSIRRAILDLSEFERMRQLNF